MKRLFCSQIARTGHHGGKVIIIERKGCDFVCKITKQTDLNAEAQDFFFFYLFIMFRTSIQGMFLSTFKVDHPTTLNPI